MGATKEQLATAAQVYQDFCVTMDEMGWKYRKNAEKLEIETGAKGDDLTIELTIKVDAERQVVTVLSHLPYVIDKEKRIDAVVAVSVINNSLVHGCVDYVPTDGHVFFRMTNSYLDSKLDKEVYKYLLLCSCTTIDNFNDKLLLLSKGMININQFIELYNKK